MTPSPGIEPGSVLHMTYLVQLLVWNGFAFFFRFVDISKLPLHDHYMKQYGDVLYRWNLLGKRAEVIKFLSEPQQPHNGVGK